jgi:hypothetical protein
MFSMGQSSYFWMLYPAMAVMEFTWTLEEIEEMK